MTSTFLLSLATASPHSIADALPHLMGMLMVLATLAVLWGVCALTAKLVTWFVPAQPAVAPAPLKHEPAPATATPPEVVAVIAAAVATCAGPRRILSIKPANPSWEKAGRQSVFSSHNIR